MPERPADDRPPPPAAADDPGPDDPTFALVNCVAADDLRSLSALLESRGFTVVVLHGEEVRDKASFLSQVAADLPPVEGVEPHNWDAFADFFWNVLLDVESGQVALVWTAAQVMVHGDLTDFLDAMRILSDVTRGVINDGPGDRAVLLFLVGEGPEFRRLPSP